MKHTILRRPWWSASRTKLQARAARVARATALSPEQRAYAQAILDDLGAIYESNFDAVWQKPDAKLWEAA